MVRLHWHVDAGQSAFVPPGGIKLDAAAGVRHLHVEMELAGQNETCPAMITMPAAYLDAARISPVGIALAHARNADTWQPPPPKQKAGALPPTDSMGPLHKLSERAQRLPLLFVIGELDPVCPTGKLKEAAQMLAGELDMRAVVLEEGLAEALAQHFAARGHVVARYYCRAKEQRRLRIFERTLDAAITCPLARGVRKWVLVGFDNGARIAAAVAVKPRPSLAGLVLVSYPLLDPQDLNGRLAPAGSRDASPAAIAAVVKQAQAFVAAAAAGDAAVAALPRAVDIVPSEKPIPEDPATPKASGEPSPEPEGEEDGEEEGGGAAQAPAAPAGRPRRPAAAAAVAAAAAAAAGLSRAPVVPQGMVPVMGPTGPVLVNSQQFMLMQQQMLAAQLQKQQASGSLSPAAAAQILEQQMAALGQQVSQQMAAMAVAAAAQQQAAAPPPQQQGKKGKKGR
eukprot:scaffold2.g7385.t1